MNGKEKRQTRKETGNEIQRFKNRERKRWEEERKTRGRERFICSYTEFDIIIYNFFFSARESEREREENTCERGWRSSSNISDFLGSYFLTRSRDIRWDRVRLLLSFLPRTNLWVVSFLRLTLCSLMSDASIVRAYGRKRRLSVYMYRDEFDRQGTVNIMFLFFPFYFFTDLSSLVGAWLMRFYWREEERRYELNERRMTCIGGLWACGSRSRDKFGGRDCWSMCLSARQIIASGLSKGDAIPPRSRTHAQYST